MEILEEVKSLGLNNYEAKVYLALLEREYVTANDIAKISRVPRARIYGILDSLMLKGLASLRPDKIKRYSAVEPEVFRGKLIDRLETQHTEQRQAVEKTILTLKKKFEIRVEESAGDNISSNYIEIVKDMATVRKKLTKLMNNSKKEILCWIGPPYITGPKETYNKAYYDLAQGNLYQIDTDVVKGRVILEIPRKKEDIIIWINRIAEDTKCTRVVKELPMKMEIYDERFVSIHLKDPVGANGNYTTQIIDQPQLAKTMKLAFEALWEQSEDSSLLTQLLDRGDYEI